MNTVTIDVRSLADNLADFVAAWKTGQASGPRISFETSELLWKTLTAKRWQLLKVLTGAGPVTIREAARRDCWTKPRTARSRFPMTPSTLIFW